MDRITGATVEPDMHGAGKDGFREGAPGSSPATIVTQEWLNAVQEEICTVIERANIMLDPGSNDQLYDAVVEASGLRSIGVAIASHASRSSPGAGDYKRAAYGEGIFVAATQSVTGPHTSNDGVTWTARSAGQHRDVCYSATNGRFLVVGDGGALATSDNGTSYTARTPDGGFADIFYCCASLGAVYVAAGATGEIQSSTGGTSGWTARTADGSFAGAFLGACSGGGLFVLVGEDSAVPEIQTSADGTTWDSQSPSEPTGSLYGVAYGGGAFVAVGITTGGDNLIMRSTDAITWETITAPTTGTGGLFSVAYDVDGGFFVAVGSTGSIAISKDGTRWNDLSRASYTAGLRGIAFGDGTAVICGSSSALRQSLAYPWLA
jgi:hypothetical protein